MKSCDRCGAANDAESRFCVSCGYRIGGNVAAPSVPPPAPQGPGTLQPPPPDTPGHEPAHVATGEAPPSSGFAFAETAPPLSESEGGIHIPGSLSHANSQSPPNTAESGDKYTEARRISSIPTGRDPRSVPPDAPRVLVGFLASYEVVELGQAWPIYQGRNTLGRHGAASGLDIEISHATTSSVHAVLRASAHPGRIMIEDLGSTNGTFVNDVQIPTGTSHELVDGDRVRLGLFTAVVKII